MPVLVYLFYFGIAVGAIVAGVVGNIGVMLGLGIGIAAFGVWALIRGLSSGRILNPPRDARGEVRQGDPWYVVSTALEKWFDWVALVVAIGGGISLGIVLMV